MCSQLILPVSACRWPAMHCRRLASLSGGQSGKLNTVSVRGVNNKTPAGCGRFQSLEGSRGFFFLSLIKTNRRTPQLVNNDEWLPESRPLPPPPDGRFQEQVCHVSSQLTSSRGLTGKKTSCTSFDLLAVPPHKRTRIPPLPAFSPGVSRLIFRPLHVPLAQSRWCKLLPK